MTNTKRSIRILTLAAFVALLIVVGGELTEVSAQRDPFVKPAWARQREPGRTGTGTTAGKGAAAENYGTPAIEQRIEFYKRLRQESVASGRPIPKVTSVLALSELSVIGIFKTPRGYAAMVEATPIRLSYTIYPGDKFFDGQLVAVEENRLVFRKVAKVGKNKFVSSVENKTLKKYSDREAIQGTAPPQAQATSDSQQAPVTTADGSNPAAKMAPVKVVSPLDEMERGASSAEDSKSDKTDKAVKKPVKVASRRH